jgi:acyl carrier protein
MSAENVASWTSLSFMQLLSKIEEQFAFKFRIFELLNIHNMGDLVSAIENHFSNNE